MKKLFTLLTFVLLTTTMMFGQCPDRATPNPNGGTFNTEYFTETARDAALVGLQSVCFPAAAGGVVDVPLANLGIDGPVGGAGVFRIRALSGTAGTFAGDNGDFNGDVIFKYANGSVLTCTYIGSDLVGSALPVELIAFDGIQKEDQINLNWQTASESNNEGFIIEKGVKTTTGIVWSRIDFVAGSGTTQTLQSYSFDDIDPTEGTNYYRLKQIDYNGQYMYSPIITVEYSREAEENAPVAIFPNPVKDQLTITNGIGQAIVYNLLGQPVRQLTIQDDRATIQLADLLVGQYFLTIFQADGIIVSKQFLKTN